MTIEEMVVEMALARSARAVQMNFDAAVTHTDAGVEYYVVPVVALVDGVVHASNAKSHERVIVANIPDGAAWDRKPVFLNHPMINGLPVPAAFAREAAIGHVRAAKRDGTKLLMEAWVEKAKTTPDILAVLASAQPNVSVGVFADTNPNDTGEFGGQKYAGVWANVRPDHLAILPAGIDGACGWAMGCGVRSAAEYRAAWPDASGFDDHGRGEAAAAHNKAYEAHKQAAVAHLAASQSHERAWQHFDKTTNKEADKASNVAHTASETAHAATDATPSFGHISGQILERSATAIGNAKAGAHLTAATYHGMASRDHYSLAIDHREKALGMDSRNMSVEKKSLAKRILATLSSALEGLNGDMDEPCACHLKPTEENLMDKKARVAALIAASKGLFLPVDAAVLEASTEERLTAIEAQIKTLATTEEVKAASAVAVKTANDATEAEAKKSAAIKVLMARADSKTEAELKALAQADLDRMVANLPAEKKELTDAEYLAAAPAGIRDGLAEGMKIAAAKKAVSIKTLVDSKRCDFSEMQLKAMSQAELDRLVKLADIKVATDFSAQMPKGNEAPQAAPAAPDMNAMIRAAKK